MSVSTGEIAARLADLLEATWPRVVEFAQGELDRQGLCLTAALSRLTAQEPLADGPAGPQTGQEEGPEVSEARPGEAQMGEGAGQQAVAEAEGAAEAPAVSPPPALVRLLVEVLRGEPAEALVAEVATATFEDHVTEDRVDDICSALGLGLARVLVEEGHDEPLLRDLAASAVETMRRQIEARHTELMEQKAETVRTLLEHLFEAVGEAILIAEPEQGRVLRGNRAAEALFAMTGEGLAQRVVADLLPALGRDQWPQIVGLESGDLLQLETILTPASGREERIVRVVAGRFAYEGHAIIHLALIDITEEVRLTRRLSTLAEDLQGRVAEQLREIEAQRHFFRSVIDAIPLRMLVLNKDLVIAHVNPYYYRGRRLTREEVIGHHLSDVFPREMMEDAGLEPAIRSALETGRQTRWSGYRMETPDHSERIVDIRLDPCQGPGGEPFVVLTVEDVTARQRQLFERTILQTILRAMLEARDLSRLLQSILTGMTAGGSAGLGFNRAFLLLVDERAGTLTGRMAVGPETREEGYRIWSQISGDHQSIDDFMRDYDRLPHPDQTPLSRAVEALSFRLTDVDRLPVLALARGQAFHVLKAAEDPRVDDALRELLAVDEFVVSPLLVKDKPIGVAVADNYVSLQPIGEDDIALLTALANHAALAIDSAQAHERERMRVDELAEAYEKLERTQQELVRSKQLAAIGEMSAIVAHEIRNPLSTIGGFAGILQRTADDSERVKRNARIIREEVERLERILGELLEFSRPRELDLEPVDTGELLREMAEMVRGDPDNEGVEVTVKAQPNLPPVMLDIGLMKQVLTNLIRNGLEAMSAGGTLTLAARRLREGGVALDVGDTGVGIAEERQGTVFDAFVTTKPSGTGLGLALSQAIVRQHGARLTVHSKLGKGSVFTVEFPGEASQAEGQAEESTEGTAAESGASRP